MSSDPQFTLADCPALLLVGGLGVRLRSAYDDGPKAMAPVNGQPFLAYLLNSLARSGFRIVILCVGYRSDQIQRWLGDGASFGLSVLYSEETQAMGTGGALQLAFSRYRLDRRFFAMNGDSILQLDFHAMYREHIRAGSQATMALARVDDSSRYGAVGLDDKGWVTSFKEKGGLPVAGYINGGVYVFEPEVMDLVPSGRPVSLEQEILPQLAAQKLRAFQSAGYFIDIGVPADFARAQTELKELENWP